MIPSEIFPEKGNKEADLAQGNSTALKVRRRSSRISRDLHHNKE
jgi:hypothetical protein